MCPEGTEVFYYQNGNKICSKCIGKQEKGAKITKKQYFKQNTPADVQAACKGGKAKKACGGSKLASKHKFGGKIFFK